MLNNCGYSEKVADELWKWYDNPSNSLDIFKQEREEQDESAKQAAEYYGLLTET